MPALHFAQAFHRSRAQRARGFEQALVGNDFQGRQRGGAADRALFMGVVAERAIASDVEIAAGDQRGERKDAAAEPLAQHDHIGNDVVMLEGEHAARAAEADGHFVENQQGTVAVAGVADDAVILRRRNLHVGRANRLDDHCADILFLAENVVEVFGAAQVAGVAAAKPALARIAGRRMLGARQ